MARVKRAVGAKKKRRQILERAKGYYGNKSRSVPAANEQVMKSAQYAFHDRRAKKGEFRRLWIQRINAACRLNDMSYSRFIAGLSAAASRSTARCWPTWLSPTRRPSPPWSSRPRQRSERCRAEPCAARTAHLLEPQGSTTAAPPGAPQSRSDEGVFVVEGVGLIAQAVVAGWVIEAQFVAPGGEPVATSAPVFDLAPNVIERVASMRRPSRCWLFSARGRRTCPPGPTS